MPGKDIQTAPAPRRVQAGASGPTSGLIPFLLILAAVIAGLVATNFSYQRYHQARRIPGAISKFGYETLALAYPGWKPEDLRALLIEADSVVLRYEPFIEAAEKPFTGKYVNVDPNGFRRVAGQGPWPPSPDHINVFLFGSSIAFGYGVPDDETIASRLQETLNRAPGAGRFRVYNFGRGFYDSTGERILFSQLLQQGRVPDIAVFLDGLTDGKWEGETGTQMTARLQRIMNDPLRGAGAELWEYVKSLPISELFRRVRMRVMPAPRPEEGAVSAQRSKVEPSAILSRWDANRRMIESAAREFGVTTLFVWQPVPDYRYDLRHHPFYHPGRERVGHVYKAMEPKRAALEAGGNFLWLADLGEGRREALFCDAFHYTAAFSKDIAEPIAAWVLRRKPPRPRAL